MTSQPTDILENLLTSTHRLTRIAAQETGRTTSPAVWRTLSILTTDGSMRVGDLARTSRVSQPTMTKLIHGLADDELVRVVTLRRRHGRLRRRPPLLRPHGTCRRRS